ncbi:hypothetical protein M3Y97_01153900 [Aphelenchoides bicaudatus]|nr:hypothetical protein M3Y97_01153900 [Aphelenchoides bicaudatus]
MTDKEFFHLLYFDYFNNSFYLDNPRGMCSKHPLDDIDDDWLPDLKQLSVCLCCDSYDPAVLLGCPENPWQQKETTCKVPPTEAPKTTATHEPTTTKYKPPPPQILFVQMSLLITMVSSKTV